MANSSTYGDLQYGEQPYGGALTMTPPVLDNLAPFSGETGVAPSTTVSLDLVDESHGINAASVKLTVDSVVAWESDAQQAGFSVAKSVITGGFRYVITPDVFFPDTDTILIEVEARDLDIAPGALLLTSYSFQTLTDVTAPVLQNLNPAAEQANVGITSDIYLEVVDPDTGVDAASVVLKVEGVTAWTGDAQQAGFTVTKNVVAGGFSYGIDPDDPLPALNTIVVGVVADDNAGVPNTLNTSYQFYTAIDAAPYFTNYSPAIGTLIPIDQALSFEVQDNIQVDESTVQISINGVVIYTGSASRAAYTVVVTPVGTGYRYDITAPSAWAYSSEVIILAYAVDSVGVPATDSWYYPVVDDSLCFEGPLNSFETSLLAPYTNAALVNMETLRDWLLTNAIDPPHVFRAARFVWLRAHTIEVGPILRDITPTPDADDRAVVLCNQCTNITLNTALRSKPNILERSVVELLAVGLSPLHVKMLQRYITTNPNDRVPLACFLVCLAKTLDLNEIVT